MKVTVDMEELDKLRSEVKRLQKIKWDVFKALANLQAKYVNDELGVFDFGDAHTELHNKFCGEEK